MGIVDLTGRAALVTGGGTRVGAAIARALGRAGCDVVVHYGSNAAGAGEVSAYLGALGRRSLLVQADLRDRGALDRLSQQALEFCSGSLTVLVHNAANFERVPPDELTARAWDDALAINASAPYLLSVALAGALCEASGSVVAIGCVSAERPWRNYLPYSVSKAALVHLVRGLSLTLAPGARANAVSPGTVLPPDDYDEEKRELLRQRVPLGRLGDADDIARAVVFLAENDYVTGQVLTVDGGRSIAG